MTIEKVAEAIKEHEGWIPSVGQKDFIHEGIQYPGKRYPGSRSWRNHNPGNIEYTGPRPGVAGSDGRFNIYVDDMAGMADLVALLRRRQAEHPEWTILDLFTSYAPPSENDTEVYAAAVARAIGGSVETKLKELA